MSASFNVGYLAPSLDDANLRVNSFSERENDQDADTAQSMFTRSGHMFLVLSSYDAES